MRYWKQKVSANGIGLCEDPTWWQSEPFADIVRFAIGRYHGLVPGPLPEGPTNLKERFTNESNVAALSSMEFDSFWMLRKFYTCLDICLY